MKLKLHHIGGGFPTLIREDFLLCWESSHAEGVQLARVTVSAVVVCLPPFYHHALAIS